MTIDGKSTTTDHPVAFVSGLFRGSQLNWVALTKEAFTIYMSVKKLSFYLTDAQILLRSDHKPLEKSLLKNTLNSKVNNWAMELEAFNIQFDYMKGSNNILMDTLSRLQGAFYWFLACLGLLPVALLFAYVFPGFLVPRCALLFWGIFVRGLHVETFVRVLRSSRCRLLIKCK